MRNETKTVTEIWVGTKYVIGVSVAWLTATWVNLPQSVALLIFMMAADLIGGVLRAFVQGTPSRQKSFRGAVKKAAVLLLVAVAYRVQKHIGNAMPISETTALFFVWHYGVSLLGNCAALGLPVPPALKDALEAFNGEKKPAEPKEATP